MARIFLYLQVAGPYDTQYDQDNPGVFTCRYELTRFEFDDVLKDVEQIRLPDESYSGGYQGAPASPESYGIDPSIEFYNDCEGTTRRGYFHNGNGTFRVEQEANSAACGYTAPPAAGTVLRHECRGFDRYRITANGTGGEIATLVQANATVCGYEPPAAVRGCMDPEATNYDPDATEDDGSCVYTPRLVVAAPGRLAVVGVPLLFTMQSAATGNMPAAARLLLTVAQLVEGTVLTIEGESFTAVLSKPAPGEFNSGITLATALASSVTLSARYRVSQPQPDQVLLVALATGSQLTPTATLSDELGGITLALTPGVDELRSQTKTEWGCYCEVWAVPAALWGDAAPDVSQAYLVDRLEQLYQASNRYTFDLAPALRPLVGHSRATSTDRLVAYFVRYGEVFIPDGEQIRQRKVVADTAVCWGLESAVPVAPTTESLVLSVPCPGGVLPAGKASYAERLYVLAPLATMIRVQLRTVTYAGVPTIQTLDVPAAGVATIELNTLLRSLPAGALRSTLTVAVAGTQLLRHVLEHGKAAACLVLLSRRGAYEAVWLRGLSEPTPKRQPLLYAEGRNQAVQRVNLTKARKLTSGPLSRAALDWLCDELASTRAVLLVDSTTGVAEPVVVSGFNPDYNEPENRYSLTFDVEPAAPFAALTA